MNVCSFCNRTLVLLYSSALVPIIEGMTILELQQSLQTARGEVEKTLQEVEKTLQEMRRSPFVRGPAVVNTEVEARQQPQYSLQYLMSLSPTQLILYAADNLGICAGDIEVADGQRDRKSALVALILGQVETENARLQARSRELEQQQ
eukprot:COSAG05_NODE_6838_length_893_cov_42522.858942_1_plen_147_part_01